MLKYPLHLEIAGTISLSLNGSHISLNGRKESNVNIIFPWEAPKLAVLAKKASLRAFESLRWGKTPNVVKVGYPRSVRPGVCQVAVTLSYKTSSPAIPKIHETEVSLKKDKGTWVPVDVNLSRSDGFFSYFRFEGERPRLSAAGINPNYPDY